MDNQLKAVGVDKLCEAHVKFTKFVQLIRVILSNDGYRGQMPFKNEKAINLDEYEKSLKKSQEERTVDYIDVLENNEVLLVENKTNIKSRFSEKEASKIREKYDHSKRIINSLDGTFHNMYKKIVVLLKDTNFQEQKNRATKLLTEKGLSCDVLTVSKLHRDYYH